MSGNPQNGSSGRLSRAAAKSVGPIAVDCAGWDADIPAEQWSSGKLINVTQSQSAVEGTFTPTASLELELAIQLDSEVKPARAFAIAAQLVAEVLAHDPGLGLAYDAARSREEEGRVVIVLTPNRPGPDAEARLEKIAEIIRNAAGEASGITLNGVRVLRAA